MPWQAPRPEREPGRSVAALTGHPQHRGRSHRPDPLARPSAVRPLDDDVNGRPPPAVAARRRRTPAPSVPESPPALLASERTAMWAPRDPGDRRGAEAFAPRGWDKPPAVPPGDS